jgi:dTMP kinase
MFITLEGPDGSGKSTQAALLVKFLEAQGRAVIHTREPGGTLIGDQIREVVHSLKNTEMHPHTEVLLYVASRAQLVAQVIRPALEDGKIVVCDRYADSTLAYQGYGHGLDLTALHVLLNFATGGLTPDLTLYFNISAEDGLKRRQQDAQGGGEYNRLDAYALDFHQRVRAGYAALIQAEPGRWAAVDAAQSIDDVHQQVQGIITERLNS